MASETSPIPTTVLTSKPGIVLVANDLRGGGTERQVSQLAAYWATKGIKVTVATLTTHDADDFYRLPPSVERVHLGANRGLLGLPAAIGVLRGLVRLRSPCIAVGFGDAINAIVWIACKAERQRSCLAIRANPQATLRAIGTAWLPLVILAYRFGDVVVTQTRAAASWVRSAIGRDAVVIGNVLRPMRQPVQPRQPLVVAIGSLLSYKGHDVLLRAFARVAPAFPDWKLVIVGEGPQRPALESLTRDLALADRASLPGQSTEVEDWLERASVFVLPSRQEGYPNALIEAMGMGAAVVSTNCPHGPAEIITDGVNGLLTPVDDVQAMAAALRHLMADPGLRTRLGAQAQTVRHRCDETILMQAWEFALFGQPISGDTAGSGLGSPLA